MEKTINVIQTDKSYLWQLIVKGDKRFYNELAADLQLFRWTSVMSGHPEWRYFEDPKKLQENDKEENTKDSGNQSL